jgi:YD repeat-containing protein|uniref:Uncharacterized protein n=1 Tax=Candidatus Aramenus sulfurataquae TaxID=1326980 RepID=A0AAE3FND1_9CREN|nr:hypothetical protein [Candidatus Aramenus sulfurataquae]
MKVKEGDEIKVTKFVFSLFKKPAVIMMQNEIYVTNPAHVMGARYNKYEHIIEVTMTNGKLILKLDEGKRLVEAYME